MRLKCKKNQVRGEEYTEIEKKLRNRKSWTIKTQVWTGQDQVRALGKCLTDRIKLGLVGEQLVCRAELPDRSEDYWTGRGVTGSSKKCKFGSHLKPSKP